VQPIFGQKLSLEFLSFYSHWVVGFGFCCWHHPLVSGRRGWLRTDTLKISSGKSMNADEHAEGDDFASSRGTMVLRAISVIALGLAVCSAIILATLRLIHCFQPNLLPWSLKSAIPLILIGIAFASLQFAVLRTRAQILLGLMVAAAFILWGVEQFVSNQSIASLIDDLVVLLFVVDLGIVIYGHLKPGAHPVSKELPFDELGG